MGWAARRLVLTALVRLRDGGVVDGAVRAGEEVVVAARVSFMEGLREGDAVAGNYCVALPLLLLAPSFQQVALRAFMRRPLSAVASAAVARVRVVGVALAGQLALAVVQACLRLHRPCLNANLISNE